MPRYLLPIDIHPLEEGGYLAICPVLQGCHAEGRTIAEAIDNIEDVAKVLLELRVEDGLPLPEELRELEPNAILHGELTVAVAK